MGTPRSNWKDGHPHQQFAQKRPPPLSSLDPTLDSTHYLPGLPFAPATCGGIWFHFGPHSKPTHTRNPDRDTIGLDDLNTIIKPGTQ